MEPEMARKQIEIAEEMVANHNELVIWSIAVKKQIGENIIALENARKKIASLEAELKASYNSQRLKRIAELEAQLAEASKNLSAANEYGQHLKAQLAEAKKQQPCQSEEFIRYFNTRKPILRHAKKKQKKVKTNGT